MVPQRKVFQKYSQRKHERQASFHQVQEQNHAALHKQAAQMELQ